MKPNRPDSFQKGSVGRWWNAQESSSGTIARRVSVSTPSLFLAGVRFTLYNKVVTATTSTDKRGRPKKLDLDTIVDAALAVLDTDGIDAVSFRRLGSDLGVSHMTLYTYFDSKEDLLNAMVG